MQKLIIPDIIVNMLIESLEFRKIFLISKYYSIQNQNQNQNQNLEELFNNFMQQFNEFTYIDKFIYICKYILPKENTSNFNYIDCVEDCYKICRNFYYDNFEILLSEILPSDILELEYIYDNLKNQRFDLIYNEKLPTITMNLSED
jgi:hypothetical protein